jgi:hypothetical protein
MKRIAVHSAPRSGSSWIGQIFNSVPGVCYRYQPLFSYAFKGALTPHSTKAEIVDFYERIAASDDAFLLQKEQAEKGNYPVFEKTEPEFCVYKEVRYHHILENLMAQDDEVKVVGIVRNPLAVIHSWLNAPKEFRKELGWDPLQEWRFAPNKNAGKPEEFNGYEKWKEVADIFLRLKERYPDRFYMLHYERFVADPVAGTKDVFGFCGIPVHDQTLAFLQSSATTANEDAYSVFRKDHDPEKWKSSLDPVIRQAILDDIAANPRLEIFL